MFMDILWLYLRNLGVLVTLQSFYFDFSFFHLFRRNIHWRTSWINLNLFSMHMVFFLNIYLVSNCVTLSICFYDKTLGKVYGPSKLINWKMSTLILFENAPILINRTRRDTKLELLKGNQNAIRKTSFFNILTNVYFMDNLGLGQTPLFKTTLPVFCLFLTEILWCQRLYYDYEVYLDKCWRNLIPLVN